MRPDTNLFSSSSSVSPSRDFGGGSIWPSPVGAAKLFATGATVGPLVDGLHNQCLLRYHVAPLSVSWPPSTWLIPHDSHYNGEVLLASSWVIPPLLGIAYVVLGYILPQLCRAVLDQIIKPSSTTPVDTATNRSRKSTPKNSLLQTRAVLAVLTTALIIKLSAVLETHPDSTLFLTSLLTMNTATVNRLILFAAAGLQWWILDGSLASLCTASLASVGGPWSELPFVGHGVWTYLPSAIDSFPLQAIDTNLPHLGPILKWVFGESDIHALGLSSITGPCYFAVAMDAIALGRWFHSTATTKDDVEVNYDGTM